MWEFISNEPNEKESKSEATEINDDRIKNKKRITTKKTNQAYSSEKEAKNSLI